MKNDYLMSIVDEVLNDMASDIASRGYSAKEINERVNKLDFEGAMLHIVEESSEMTIDFFKEHMYEIALEEQFQTAEFLAHQEIIWGKCFAASKTMYVMAVETAQLYAKHVQEDIDETIRKPKLYTYLSLQHMHGRACQEFLEILCLMRNGFADCAYARWRSMYELCCTGQFIIEQGEKIAKQYFEQSESDNMPKSNKDSFAWTQGAVGKNGDQQSFKSFKAIQDYCECNEAWMRQYKLSCLVNHASPEGTFKRLANRKVRNAISIGRSDYGITTPAEHSAISLQQITSMFVTIFPSLDGFSRCKVLHGWVDIVREMYFSVKDESFNEANSEKEEK